MSTNNPPFDWSKFLSGGATRPDAMSGLNPQFNSSLQNLFSHAPAEIQSSLGLKSAYRSPEVQAQLYNQALQKYGSEQAARQWVAPPGKSNHNHGMAADLSFASPEARQWAHDNAGQYGLSFPLSNEPWHVELASARNGMHQAMPTGSPQQPAQAQSGLPPLAPMKYIGADPMAQQTASMQPQSDAQGLLSSLTGGQSKSAPTEQSLGLLAALQQQQQQPAAPVQWNVPMPWLQG